MVIEVLDQTKRKLFQKKQAFDTCAKVLGPAHYDVDGIKLDLGVPTKTGFTLFVELETCSDFAFFYMPSRGVRLEYPNRTPSAIADGEQLAKEIQQSLSSVKTGSFDDEMRSLRGRSWSL
ncbi:MAG: hypothetical protein E3J40_00860 [Dehalococcoidia bacterium]|nr:MAG: hypothetical protein E3J40_00860 [Dehalococcoidia bacterium]